MYRNDRVVPFFALVLSLALFLVTYLDGRHIAALEGHAPEELSVGQIGLIALGVVFLLYALMGFVSVWLEGEELVPGQHRARPGNTHIVGIALSVVTVAVSGLFAQAMLNAQRTQVNHPRIEGVLFGIVALLVAAVLALYKRHYQDEDVRAESENTEVPW